MNLPMSSVVLVIFIEVSEIIALEFPVTILKCDFLLLMTLNGLALLTLQLFLEHLVNIEY